MAELICTQFDCTECQVLVKERRLINTHLKGQFLCESCSENTPEWVFKKVNQSARGVVRGTENPCLNRKTKAGDADMYRFQKLRNQNG